MWNRVYQVTGFASAPEDEKAEEIPKSLETEEQMAQQNVLIEQLKHLLRQSESQLKEKENELMELSTKHQRSQMQHKAKVLSLTNQLKDKPPKKEDADFDDSSSTDSSDQSTRGRVVLLRKQLEAAKLQLEKKEKENKEVVKRFEDRINVLEAELKMERQVASERSVDHAEQIVEQKSLPQPSETSSTQEMYAQIVYKDSKILELNNQLLGYERTILDLREHIKEKDEVLQSRNLAVQLISADMSLKGKTVVDELEETRMQMKTMQSKFADCEAQWKEENENMKSGINDLRQKYEEQLFQKGTEIRNLEDTLTKVNAARYELTTRNADQQKKIVLMEENSDKQCEAYRNKIDAEMQNLQSELENEKAKSCELQNALTEAASQSESMVLKARVIEQNKLKALEKELAALKELQAEKQKPEEITQLQQQVAVLEEEKGTLQLKLIEVDEQISMQDKLKAENAEIRDKLTLSEEKILRMDKMLNELESEKCSWKQKFDEQEGAYNLLKTNFEELNQQNSAMNQSLEEAKVSKGGQENKICTLEQEVKELATKNSELSEQMTALNHEKVSLEMKVIELEEVHEKDDQEKANLLKRMESFQSGAERDHLPELQEDINALEAENTELKNMLSSSERHGQDIAKQMDSLQVKFGNLQEDIRNRVEENSVLKNENEMLHGDLNRNEAETSKVRLDLNDAVSKCFEKESQYANLSECVTVLREQLGIVCATIGAKNEDFAEKWKIHTEELEGTKQELEMLFRGKEELEKAICEKKSETDALAENIEQLTEALESEQFKHEEKASTFDHAIKELEKERTLLEATVHEKNEMVGTLKGSVEEKEWIINKLEEDTKAKIMQLSALEQENALVKEEVDTLKQKLAKQSEEVNFKMTSLLEQISDLESEVSAMKNERELKDQVVSNLRKELSGVQLEFENLMHSHSQKETFYQTACENKDRMLSSLQEQLTEIRSNLREKDADLQQICKNLETKHETELEKNKLENQEIVSGLEVSLKESKDENEKLEKELSLKTNEVTQLNLAYSEFQKMHEDSKVKHESELRNVIGRCEAAVLTLETTLLQLKEENESLNEEICMKEEIVDQLKAESEDLNNELENERIQLSEAIQECKSAENCNGQLREQLNVATQQVSVLEEQISSSHLSASEKDELHNSVLKQKLELENETERLTKKIQNLKVLINEHEQAAKSYSDGLNNEIATKSVIIDELVSEKMILLQKHADEMKDLGVQLDESKITVASKVTELENIETNFRQLSVELNSLQELVALLRCSKEELQRRNSSLNEKVQLLCQENSEKIIKLVSQINSLKTQTATAKEDTKKWAKELNNMFIEVSGKFGSELGKFQDGLKTAQNENRQLLDVNQSLEAVLQNCESEIKALKSCLDEKDCKTEAVESTLNEQKEKFEQLVRFKTKCYTFLSKAISVQSGQDTFGELGAENEEHILQHLNDVLSSLSTLQNKVDILEKENGHLQSKVQNFVKGEKHVTAQWENLSKKYEELEQSNAILLQEKSSCMLILKSIVKQVYEVSENSKIQTDLTMSRLNDLFSKVTKLKGMSDASRAFLVSLKTANAALEHERVNTGLQLQKLHKSFESLLDPISLTDTTSISENFAQIHRAVLCEFQSQKMQSQVKEDEVNRLVRQVEANEEFVTPLKHQLKALQSKNIDLEEEVKQIQLRYEKSISDFNGRLQAELSANLALKEQIQMLRHEVNKVLESQHQLDSANITIRDLRGELERMKSQFQEYQAREMATSEKMSQLGKELGSYESLKLDMEKCVSEKNILADELETCKSVEKELKRQCSHAENCLKHLTETLSTAELDSLEISEFRPVLLATPTGDTYFHSLVEKLQNQLLHIVDSRDALRGEVSTLQGAMTSLQHSLQTMSLEREELNQAICALKEPPSASKERLFEGKVELPSADAGMKKCVSYPSVERCDVLQKEILVQSSHIETPTQDVQVLKQENDSLKTELSSTKAKCDKMLLKLRAFKNKIEKLTNEMKSLTSANEKLSSVENENAELQDKISVIDEENLALRENLLKCTEQKELKISQLILDVNELKGHNSTVVHENKRLTSELNDCKSSWEQCKERFGAQKEENAQLQLKLNECYNELQNLRTAFYELQSKDDQNLSERGSLQKEVENLREHVNMLIADNDTYQTIVEKLNHTKAKLEKEVMIEKDRYVTLEQTVKERHSSDIEEIRNHYLSELEELGLLRVKANEHGSLMADMQAMCDHLQLQTESLSVELSNALQDRKAMEVELSSALKSLEETQKSTAANIRTTERLNKEVQSDTLHFAHEEPVCTDRDVTLKNSSVQSDPSFLDRIVREARAEEQHKWKYQIDTMNEELMLCRDTIHQYAENEDVLREELAKVNASHAKVFSELKSHVERSQSLEKSDDSSSSKLESELQQAMSSLHKQTLRSEELSLELNKLVEERNTLKLRFTQLQQQYHQKQLECQEYRKEECLPLRSSESTSEEVHPVKVQIHDTGRNADSPLLQSTHVPHPMQAEIATLHQRLLETETTCQELRKANDALDSALTMEKEQRKLVEEELGYAQKQLIPEERAGKDEYRLLLGDFEEPEMLVETNFSITRSFKSHAYKLRRWLKGRRGYLLRTYQRKKYSELLYLFYILAVHLWLLLCLVRHS